MVDLDRSASQTTTAGFSRPIWTSARPKASRVAGPGFNSYLVRAGMMAAVPQGSLQFLEGKLHLSGSRSRPVELGIVFHKRHSLALHRVSHNAGGLPFGGLSLVQR